MNMELHSQKALEMRADKCFTKSLPGKTPPRWLRNVTLDKDFTFN